MSGLFVLRFFKILFKMQFFLYICIQSNVFQTITISFRKWRY